MSFPCFGFLKKEKHVLLLSVADVVIEQGKAAQSFVLVEYLIRVFLSDSVISSVVSLPLVFVITLDE